MVKTEKSMVTKILQNIATFFLSFLEKIFPILFSCIFFVIFFFLAGCAPNKHSSLTSCLTNEEKKDLEYFLRLLIFENHGAFVLFGSKPLCEVCVMDTDDTEVDELKHQQLLASMSSEERAEFECKLKKLEEKRGQEKIAFLRNPYKGWLALEKVIGKLNIKKYILVADDEGMYGARSYRTLILANIQRVALILAENYPIFKEASGMDFHPLEMALELQNPRSAFWNHVFKIDNHLAKGLLFGFGRKNSFFEDWNLKQLSKNSSLHLSEQAVSYLKNVYTKPSASLVKIGEGGPSNFTIPIFGAVEDDEMIKLYEKEKKEIEKIYHGKDFVGLTLQRLAS
jgi:hypothetical protein